jgi:hypothetical protein
VACALLVSLALVFSLLQVRWIYTRAVAVQSVADACALSGEQVVRGFTSVADVCDACIVTLGLSGVVVLGVGLVTSAIPGCGAQGLEIVSKGADILKARTKFAESCAEGLQKLEKTLPYLIVADSYLTVEANDEDGSSYAGVAIPYPAESQSTYDTTRLVDDGEVQERAEKLAQASDELADAKAEADAAKATAYRADCVDDPMCLRSRARDLGGLATALNPYYASVSDWTFGSALTRARAYYAARLVNEAPASNSPAEVTKSELRRAYYRYALAQMNASSCYEAAGSVSVDLAELARNTETTRATKLYTERRWPYSYVDGRRVLHSYASCPAVETVEGYGSLAEQDAGTFGVCATCGLTTAEMGRVASASTNIDNGFEHYWRIIVEQSEIYEEAANREAEAEAAMQEEADDVLYSFKKAVSDLAPPDTKLCPAGAYGCIAFVSRSAVQTPESLVQAFAASGEVPAGVAISGAVLAPDDSAGSDSVVTSVLSSIAASGSDGFEGVVHGLASFWSSALEAYGAACDTVSAPVNKLFDTVDKIGLSSVSSWLKNKLSGVVAALGLAPADIRQKKPVLCATGDILSKAGMTDSTRLKTYIQALPDSGTAADYVRALGRSVFDEIRSDGFTVAEIPIPGTDLTVPLTIDLKRLAGLSS